MSLDWLGWSPAERAAVAYLRAAGHVVDPGDVTPRGRSYDARVDEEPVGFKSPALGATSSTMLNRANESKRRGGQARFLIFDVRAVGLPITEARRGIARIRGAYSEYYDGVRAIGDGFDVEMRWKSAWPRGSTS